MNDADRQTLARAILAASTADETEVLVLSSDSALSRFTHETFNQNVAAATVEISVRAIVDGRSGVASSDAVRRPETLVERAVQMARLSPRDSARASLPVGTPDDAPPGARLERTARATPEVRAAQCGVIFDAAEKSACWCAGYASTSAFGITVANSSGALSSFDGTDAGINVKMIGPDSSGWAEAHSSDVGQIDAAAVGSRAATKSVGSAGPRSVEPGPWTVILEPAAFGELLAYLAGHFSAQRFDEGSSFCSGGLDRTYFGENVTIRDDYAHPLHPSMPFDFEGFPTQRLALVQHGIVRNVVTDSYYARKLDRPNTGHALPAPNAYGPQARNIVVEPGSASIEELIAETQRAILVTRFWYIRTVDQKQAIVTGMTRDGNFLIENGVVTGGVRNMRFNQSILEALRSCTLAREQQRTASYDYDLVTPAARIDGFMFTSVADF